MTPTTGPTGTTRLEGIDLLAETWGRGVPHDQFDRLRREAPVYWHPEPNGPGFWALTKHADVRAVSHDWRTFSSELGATFIPDQDEEALAFCRQQRAPNHRLAVRPPHAPELPAKSPPLPPLAALTEPR